MIWGDKRGQILRGKGKLRYEEYVVGELVRGG